MNAHPDAPAAALPAEPPVAPDLEALFRPRRIAVVGASADPRRIGGAPVDYLKRYGFAGAIHPVNPKYPEIQGLRCAPSLQAIGEQVDLAIVSVPARQVLDTLHDAAAAGVRAAVLFSSGFAEIDEAGREAQRALTAQARSAGIRLLGPNCMGLMSMRERAFSTFTPAIAASAPPAGNIAIVSQSGAFGAYAMQLARARGLGLSYWVTTGNEADVELGDCVEWLAGDPSTQVILCYMEACRDGAKLCRAFERAALAGKRVVITKVGRTVLGQAAAASHTAALAGEDAVYDAMFAQYGAWRAQTIDEFFTVGYAASMAELPKGPRIGLLTVSGGVGALMADEADTLSLQAPELPADRQQALRARVPFAATRNPIDFTGQFTSEPELLDFALDLVADSGCYDMMPVFMAAAAASPALRPKIVASLLRACQRHPHLPIALISMIDDIGRRELEAAGCLVFEEPSHAVRALAALRFFAQAHAAIARRQAARAEGSPPQAQRSTGQRGPGALDQPSAADQPAARDREPPVTRALSEYEALHVLARAGVNGVQARLAVTADAAAQAAAAIGFPVVIKIASADIAHKTEVGGVRLNLRDEAAVREAFAAVTASARLAVPHARIDGTIVAPMVAEGIETIVGTATDPVFGPVVMCGIGGVLAEVIRDTCVRLAPVDHEQALAMIRSLRANALFDGFRGAPAADVEALAHTLVALSHFAVAQQASVASIDINPLRVMPRGRGVMALDALIVPHRSAAPDLTAATH